jgi:glycosyltransferase involved in cell wall biosynthesis
MATGRAVVSTSLGVEGYQIVDGQVALLADAPQDMAAIVLQLLENSELRQRLGEQGQSFAQKYDWRNIVPLFDDVYESLRH